MTMFIHSFVYDSITNSSIEYNCFHDLFRILKLTFPHHLDYLDKIYHTQYMHSGDIFIMLKYLTTYYCAARGEKRQVLQSLTSRGEDNILRLICSIEETTNHYFLLRILKRTLHTYFWYYIHNDICGLFIY